MHRTILPAVACALVLAAAPARADHPDRFSAMLVGFQEVPSILSETTGTVDLIVDRGAQVITFTLEYSGFTSAVIQSHIHFGERKVAGGVMVFFCGGGSKPACPSPSGTVTGTIVAADVIGPAAQGVSAGDFQAVLDALDADAAYANVHTANHPGGEIRGQVRRHKRDHDHD